MCIYGHVVSEEALRLCHLRQRQPQTGQALRSLAIWSASSSAPTPVSSGVPR